MNSRSIWSKSQNLMTSECKKDTNVQKQCFDNIAKYLNSRDKSVA